MRVLVVSEGNNELGDSGRVGALPILVARLVGHETEIECERIRNDKVRVHLRPGKSSGFLKRGQGWIRYAEREGYDAFVFVIDEDGDRERPLAINDCQDDPHFSLRRAMGVAIRSFDAWMLADEKALSNALRQSNPESNARPKATCESVRDAAKSELSLTELYSAIAQHADLELIAKRCTKGFGPFANRVMALRIVP